MIENPYVLPMHAGTPAPSPPSTFSTKRVVMLLVLCLVSGVILLSPRSSLLGADDAGSPRSHGEADRYAAEEAGSAPRRAAKDAGGAAEGLRENDGQIAADDRTESPLETFEDDAGAGSGDAGSAGGGEDDDAAEKPVDAGLAEAIALKKTMAEAQAAADEAAAAKKRNGPPPQPTGPLNAGARSVGSAAASVEREARSPSPPQMQDTLDLDPTSIALLNDKPLFWLEPRGVMPTETVTYSLMHWKDLASRNDFVPPTAADLKSALTAAKGRFKSGDAAPDFESGAKVVTGTEGGTAQEAHSFAMFPGGLVADKVGFDDLRTIVAVVRPESTDAAPEQAFLGEKGYARLSFASGSGQLAASHVDRDGIVATAELPGRGCRRGSWNVVSMRLRDGEHMELGLNEEGVRMVAEDTAGAPFGLALRAVNADRAPLQLGWAEDAAAFVGGIGEVIAFDYPLPDKDLAKLTKYISKKWEIGLDAPPAEPIVVDGGAARSAGDAGTGQVTSGESEDAMIARIRGKAGQASGPSDPGQGGGVVPEGSTGYDEGAAAGGPANGSGGATPSSGTARVRCPGRVFERKNIDLWTPPPGAEPDDVYEWEQAVESMKEKASNDALSGEPLREMILEEVKKLDRLRHKLFCHLAAQKRSGGHDVPPTQAQGALDSKTGEGAQALQDHGGPAGNANGSSPVLGVAKEAGGQDAFADDGATAAGRAADDDSAGRTAKRGSPVLAAANDAAEQRFEAEDDIVSMLEGRLRDGEGAGVPSPVEDDAADTAHAA